MALAAVHEVGAYASGSRETVSAGECCGRVQRLGVYSVFSDPDVGLTRAIETPKVRFHNMITVALGEHGAINHVIDDTPDATAMHPRVTPKVTDFP